MQLSRTRLLSIVTAAALVFATACGGGGDDDNILKGGDDGDANPQEIATLIAGAARAEATAAASLTPTRGPSTSTTPSSSPTRTATTTSGTTATTLTGDAGDLQKAMANLSTQKSFKANVAADAGANGKFEIVMEVALPDKLHVTLKSAPSSIPALFNNAELIAIGTDLYVKTGGKWTMESTEDLGLGDINPTDFSDFAAEFEDLGDTTVVTKGSTDTVNGKRCQVYGIKDTSDPSATGDVCIADNLPQRLKVNFDGGSATITFSDFNANINIQKPI